MALRLSPAAGADHPAIQYHRHQRVAPSRSSIASLSSHAAIQYHRHQRVAPIGTGSLQNRQGCRHSVSQASTSGTDIHPISFRSLICRHSVSQASTSGTSNLQVEPIVPYVRHSVSQASTSGTNRVLFLCREYFRRHSVSQASTSGTYSACRCPCRTSPAIQYHRHQRVAQGLRGL